MGSSTVRPAAVQIRPPRGRGRAPVVWSVCPTTAPADFCAQVLLRLNRRGRHPFGGRDAPPLIYRNLRLSS
jgi:hypothetical protein